MPGRVSYKVVPKLKKYSTVAELNKGVSITNIVKERVASINSLLYGYYLFYDLDTRVTLSPTKFSLSVEKQAELEKQKVFQMQSAFKSLFMKKKESNDGLEMRNRNDSFLKVKNRIEKRGSENSQKDRFQSTSRERKDSSVGFW